MDLSSPIFLSKMKRKEKNIVFLHIMKIEIREAADQ